MTQHQEAILPLKRFRNELVSRGYQEAITYSFVDPKVQSLLHPSADALVLPHPISIEMSAMRVSLLPGLLSSVVYNQNRQQSRIRLFESGLKFVKDDAAENGIQQTQIIGGVIYGNTHNEHWGIQSQAVDFFDIKGDVEALLNLTCDMANISFVAEQNEGLHPGQSASILRNGKKIGYLGCIHPEIQSKLNINNQVFAFEIELLGLENRVLPEAVDVSKFPSNRRDIAVVVKDSVNAGDILESIKKVGGNQLVDLNLFDVYKGKGVEADHKSLAIALTLQNAERTLEEKDINSIVDLVVAELAEQFNASLRD